MIIVGVGHKSRQGKDTFASFLMTYLRMNTKNKKIVKMGFADPLKSICHQLYGWAGLKPKEHYDRFEDERKIELPLIGKTPVQIWIDVGNHMRIYDKDVWMRALMKGTVADVLIVTDVRYENEAQAIFDHNGFVVKINRPGFPGLDSITDNALNNYTRWTEIIENDGDLSSLNDKTIKFAEKYCKGIL